MVKKATAKEILESLKSQGKEENNIGDGTITMKTRTEEEEERYRMDVADKWWDLEWSFYGFVDTYEEVIGLKKIGNDSREDR